MATPKSDAPCARGMEDGIRTIWPAHKVDIATDTSSFIILYNNVNKRDTKSCELAQISIN